MANETDIEIKEVVKEKEIPTARFAGVILILIPVIYWLTMYLRFDCGGGHCSIGLDWMLVGLAGVMLGLILLLFNKEK